MQIQALKYPVTGVQHTRAIVALATTEVFLTLYKDEEKNAFSDFLNEIRDEIDACGKSTKKKAMSAGTQRALQACSQIIVPYIDMKRHKGDELFSRWSALVFCARYFLYDALATAPQFTRGATAKHWHKLVDDVESLSDSLGSLDKSIDALGTKIYLKAFCALNDEEYQPKEYGLC